MGKDNVLGVEVMTKNTTLAVTIQHMDMAKRNEDGIYIATNAVPAKLNVTQVLVSRMSLTEGKMEHILVHNVDGDEAIDLIKVLTGHKDV